MSAGSMKGVGHARRVGRGDIDVLFYLLCSIGEGLDQKVLVAWLFRVYRL